MHAPNIKMNRQVYRHNQPFTFENGAQIPFIEIAYHTYGTLNTQRNNVVWVCHALTANADVMEWWPGLFGDKDWFNPQDHFIVCANILGSPYGTTQPCSINPNFQKPYYLDFPAFTIRDMVQAHRILADHLQIEHIQLLIGGSLGGQQAMEWAIAEPQRFEHLILIATNAFHSPWGIAFNESQRLAIQADPTFHEFTPEGGAKGLKAARSIALLSYRTYDTYTTTQMESDIHKTNDFKAASYQNYQGDKLVNRFNAYSYYYLTRAMDSHQVGRNRGSVEHALRQIKARTLVMGISSDLLFPINEQQFLASHIPGAKFSAVPSFYGHDGFLIETKQLTKEISQFLAGTSLDTAKKVSHLHHSKH
jgi:homoserine O-acetyltransferase